MLTSRCYKASVIVSLVLNSCVEVSLPRSGNVRAPALSAGNPRGLSGAASSVDVTGGIHSKLARDGVRSLGLPLLFQANRGQADVSVKYTVQGPGWGMLLKSDEVLVALQPQVWTDPDPQAAPGKPPQFSDATRPMVQLKVLGARPTLPEGEKEHALRSNYLLGNDPTRWSKQVPGFERVRYREIYKGVDLVFYGNGRSVQFDFMLRAGADPASIRLGFGGAGKLEVDLTGDLQISTGNELLRIRKPVVYQNDLGTRRFVEGAFALTSPTEVRFQLGSYDAGKPLIIDPVIDASRTIQGNGSDSSIGIGTDAQSNVYIVFNTTSTDLQGATNASSGQGDFAVAKFNSNLDPQWLTYVGGTGLELAQSLSVASNGSTVVGGGTTSTNYPTSSPIQGAYGGPTYDGFITKLNPNGTGFDFSTYVGGNNFDWVTGVHANANGKIYFSGATQSSNLQTTANAFQKVLGGGTCSGAPCSDALVGVVTPSNAQWDYLSYLGGNRDEAFDNAITSDAAGNSYVWGITSSTNFPVKNALQSQLAGAWDFTLTKFSPTYSLDFSTLLGGSSTEIATGIVQAGDGAIYTTGHTFSTNFPTTIGAFQTSLAGTNDADGVVTKWNVNGLLLGSTRIGGSGNDSLQGPVWTARGLFVPGFTLSADYPVNDFSEEGGPSAGGNGAFVTENGGETWTRSNYGLRGPGGGEIFPHSAGQVGYVDRSGELATAIREQALGVRYVWRPRARSLEEFVVNDSEYNSVERTLVVATNKGVWLRDDIATDYTRANGFDSTVVVTDLSVDPSNSQRMIATTNGRGLFISTDGGRNWTAVQSGLPANLFLTSVAANGTNIAVGTTSSTTPLFRCPSDGTNCTPGGTGLLAAPVFKLVFDSANPANLYASQFPVGSVHGGLYKSTDTGSSFSPVIRTQSAIRDFQFSGNTMYLGMDAASGLGILKTEDGGQTWRDLGLNRNGISSILIDPSNSQRIWAATDAAFSGTSTFFNSDLSSLGFSFYNNDNPQASRNGNDGAAVGSNGTLYTLGTFAASGTTPLATPIVNLNNFAVALNAQNGLAAAPKLEVKKTGSSFAVPGQLSKYTIRVKNLSDSDATQVNIEDFLSAYLYPGGGEGKFVQGTGTCETLPTKAGGNSIVRCELAGSLAPQAEAIVEVSATFGTNLQSNSRSYKNNGSAKAIINGASVEQYDQITLDVAHFRYDDDPYPYITDLKPRFVEPGATVAVEGTSLDGVNGVTFNGVPGTIVGNSGSRVFVLVPQELSGQVNMSVNTAQGPAATVAGVQIGLPKADVAVERIFQAVNQSQKTIVYSITITNKGPSAASNVVVNVGAGSVTGLLATQITPPSGASCNSVGSQCTIPTLAPGDSKVIGLVFNYAGFSGSTLVNQVSVSSSTPDPDSANNSKGVSTNSASAVPQISGFSPSSGAPGSNLTINGTNLGSGGSQIQFLRNGSSAAVVTSTTVSFGTVPAEIVSISNTQIVVKVPAGASTGPVTVTTPNSSAVSTSTFTISDGSSGTVTSFVPIVLTAAGLNNSFFTTELTLSNRGAARIALNVSYTAAFGDGGGSVNTSLPPGQQYVIDNAVEWLRGLGISIPDSGNRGGTLAIRASGFLLPSDFAATARTTTAATGGRAGLAYSGVQTLNAVTEPSFIYGLRQTSQDRANLAVQHAGKASDGDVVLRLTVYSGDQTGPSVTPLPDITLSPGGFSQISGILTSNGLALSNGFVKVQRISGSAPYYAYGVINDQANSDGSFVPPVAESSSAGAAGITVPVVVEANAFSSELTATNRSTASKTVRLNYVSGAIQAPNSTAAFTLVLQPQEQRIIPNLVQYLRDQGIAGVGPKGPAFAGALFAKVDGGDVNDIFLGVRTAAPGGGGQFGLFYVGVPNGRAFDGEGWIFGLQQDQENRSNVALINTGEVDPNNNTYTIELYDGSSGSKVATIANIALRAWEWRQIGTILATYAPGVSQGYARIIRTAGNNPSIYYGVTNDGGQPGERTGDGAYIPASR